MKADSVSESVVLRKLVYSALKAKMHAAMNTHGRREEHTRGHNTKNFSNGFNSGNTTTKARHNLLKCLTFSLTGGADVIHNPRH